MHVPHQNPEEVFEDRYTSLFTQRLVGRGTKVTYDRDRAATDLGYHLLAPGTLEHLQVKCGSSSRASTERPSGAERLKMPRS